MHECAGYALSLSLLLCACRPAEAPSPPPAVDSGPASETGAASVESRDMTSGDTWIERLERPDRIAGLRIDDVIRALGLKDGDVVADIGAGSGAFSIPFAKAVGPSGRLLAVDIWPELMDYVSAKAERAGLANVETVLCMPDDPMLPPGQVSLAFFHDVFHNVPDRQAYLERLASSLAPDGRIAIIEQEFDDPIAQLWDVPENRITPEQVDEWMRNAGFALSGNFDLFRAGNNPAGTGMPERWFVVYSRSTAAGDSRQ